MLHKVYNVLHSTVQAIILYRLQVLHTPYREREREFLIDHLPVQIHLIIVMIRWNGLAPWEFEFPFPGSLTSSFLVNTFLALSLSISHSLSLSVSLSVSLSRALSFSISHSLSLSLSPSLSLSVCLSCAQVLHRSRGVTPSLQDTLIPNLSTIDPERAPHTLWSARITTLIGPALGALRWAHPGPSPHSTYPPRGLMRTSVSLDT